VTETLDPVAEAGPRRRKPLRRGWRWLLRLLLAVLVVWAVVRATGFDQRTPLAQLISYTPYVGAFAVLVLLATFLTRQLVPTIVALVLVLVFGWFLLPRLLPDDLIGPAKSVPKGWNVRVMSVNLFKGRASADAVLDRARREDPDVLTVQELTPEWVDRFAAAGGLKQFRYRALEDDTGASGTGIYAKFPLTEGTELDERSSFRQAVAMLRVPGRPAVAIVSAHPAPPLTYDKLFVPPRTWVRDYGLLPDAPRAGSVQILAGDFNATLDHVLLRRLIATGYLDAAEAVGHGWEPTWPERGHAGLPPVTIDHVLVDQRASAQSFHSYKIKGSDHKAVVADLTLPGS
jgi:endonuclease/exonuclease/phosphatase (EEP) superfamily protein YafD